MDTIESFRGKRNTVITLFIPPHTKVIKLLESIRKQVKAIRHSNKKNQILQVISDITDHTKAISEFQNNGMILCSGLGNDNKILYEQIYPNKLISEMKYYYDDVFNVDLIREYVYANIVSHLSNTLLYSNKITSDITNCTHLYVIGDDVEKAFLSNTIKNVYFFGENQIPKQLLTSAIKNNTVIYKFNKNDIHRKDFQKKFGDVVGELYYPNEN